MKKRSSSSLHKRTVEVSQGKKESSPRSTSLGRKILMGIGWAIVYVFVFYLGNVSGEYVAAHMPILPSIPRVSVHMDAIKKLIPKVSIAWKWPMSAKNTQTVSHTRLVIVRGQFINMPQAGATEVEQKEFVAAVEALAVDKTDITVSESCEVNPPFIRVKQGTSLSVTSTSTGTLALMFGEVTTSVSSNQMTSVPLTQSAGAYPISCNGSIVGFYRVY